MKTPLRLPQRCCYCGGTSAQLMRQIFHNGSQNIVYVCDECGRHMDRLRVYWPKSILTGNIEDLPVLTDKRDDQCCAVEGCVSRDVEWHHWAPKEFWGRDADHWPTVYLCRYHHRMWHDVMSGIKLYTSDPVIEDSKALDDRFITVRFINGRFT